MKFVFHTLIALFLLMTSGLIASEESGKSTPDCYVTKVSIDKTLKRNEAIFVFTCFNQERKKINQEIKYSYNGQERTEKPDSLGKITLNVTPGKYKFQFFLDGNHQEIYTDSIKAKSKTKTEVTLSFKDATIIMTEDKPVIYLYPPQTTHVSVKLDLKGELLFTYPAYNKGWEVEAQPDGTLTQKEQTYSYLFWEGKSEIKKTDIKTEEGFVVSTNELLSFFEKNLQLMGLSSKEKQDFITYWYPRMSQHQKHYIHFLFNNEFATYAHLDIKPKPDNVFRVFMVWDPLEEGQQPKVKQQLIPQASRKGFTVIEWGGTEVNYFEEEKN